MIIPEVTSRLVDRIAISEERKFNIKSSAKAFKLLSSTLYPDPIAAPIRELATNAIDSHIEAKTDEPFVVHLPNLLEPYFSIRDFGTGMTDEKVDSVYCTYFASTRSDSNEFTGAFGLGSKTPFCYTDTFNVTSFVDGTKHLYTAFLEDGEPKMAKFAEIPTDEKNGVEVSFPVKESDFLRFFETAKRIYSNFTKKPKVVGNTIAFEEVTYLFEGTNWKMKNVGSRSLNVVMGNISYPVSAYKCGIATHTSEYYVAELKLELYFDIGELQPTVSREDIQYDPITCEKIKTRLREVKVELENLAKKMLDGCKSYYEARVKYYELNYDHAQSQQIKTVLSKCGFTYEGKPINSPEANLRNLYYDYTTRNGRDPSYYSFSSVELVNVKGTFIQKIVKSPAELFSYSPKNKLFISDEPSEKLSNIKLKKYVIDNGLSGRVYVFNKTDTKYYTYLLTELGVSEDMLLSVASLPLPEKKPRAVKNRVSRPRNIKSLKQFIPSTFGYSHKLDTITMDINIGEHLYVNSSFGDIVNELTSAGGTTSLNTLNSYLLSYEVLTGKLPNVIVFNSATKLTNFPPNWKHFFVEIKDKFDEYIKKNSPVNYAQINDVLNEHAEIIDLATRYSDKVTKSDELNEIKQLASQLKVVSRKSSNIVDKVPTCLKHLIVYSTSENSHVELKEKCVTLKKKHPEIQILTFSLPHRSTIGETVYDKAATKFLSTL